MRTPTNRAAILAAFLSASVLAACKSAPSRAELEALRAKAEATAEPGRPRDPLPQQGTHSGPPVARGIAGTARFAALVRGAFDAERAMALARFADGYYREPGNEGFDAVLARLESELRAAGYGGEEGFLLEVVDTEQRTPAWTPVSARLALVEGGNERVLLEFSAPGDPARTMLPRNAPATDAELSGPIVRSIEDARAGAVVVLAEPPPRSGYARAEELGALAVLCAGIEDYNVDPTGRERHLDAIQYSSVAYPCPVPVARISKRVYDELSSAGAEARAVFRAAVRFEERPMRTLVATIAGAVRPNEAVAIAAHVQEPGACDNASGVGGIAEVARALAAKVRSGELARPARSVVFVFGQEMAQTRIFLERTELQVVAGISADMLGESSAETGAIALLERAPDPGAVRTLPPDEHTAWGSRPVARDEVVPSGLAVVARCALLDVADLEPRDAPWTTREHPFEGGSDHDVFLKRGIPAVLFWHFPDFAYHTSLDRMPHVDPHELARTASSIATCALAVADAQPGDLDRYLASLKLEFDVRLAACAAAKADDLAADWRAWSTVARQWLRRLCLPNVATAATPPSPR